MMKKIFALVLFTAAAGLVFAADPAEGFWVSVDEKTGRPVTGWELYVQNGRLYGRILSLADFPQDIRADACRDSYRDFPVRGRVSEMPVVGTTWIFGLLPSGQPGRWKDGHVIDPAEGRIYGCTIIFHPADKKYSTETLEMRGTFGPFGRSQFWRRATQAEASTLG